MPDQHSARVARALWEAVDLPVVVSANDRIIGVNPAFTTLTGWTADDLTGTSVASLLGPARSEAPPSDGSDSIDEDAARPLLLGTRGGSTIEVACSSRQVKLDGQTLAVSMFAPRTGRSSAGEATESKRRHRELFDEDGIGRFVATQDWRIVESNAALARMLGVERADLAGRALLEFVPDGSALQKLWATANAEQRAGPMALVFEGAGGVSVDVLCSVAVSLDTESRPASMRGQVVEITDEKRLVTRLSGAERMEVIGRLAGGLAHDFNNLLLVIGGNAERLIETSAEGGATRNAATAILNATGRAESLTRQLLAYGRRQVFTLEPLALPHLVSELRPLLAEILGGDIVIDFWSAPDVPSISADARQIERILVNLSLNAREAMPSGGTLSLSVDATAVGVRLERDRLWLRPGRYARLVVADTGQGMDPVTRAHAFQPFFTTKKMGEGRGLGLATVYGIVKQSRGFVWVDSQTGRGARFTLLFPVIADAQSPLTPIRPATETVLLVVGDPALRMHMGDALRRRGYQVLAAEDGAAALDQFASHPGRVHLVLADAAAVTGEGAPLAARLKGIDPLVQSLVMLDATHRHAGPSGILPTTPSIQRPFTLRGLAEKVREVLDSGEGR